MPEQGSFSYCSASCSLVLFVVLTQCCDCADSGQSDYLHGRGINAWILSLHPDSIYMPADDSRSGIVGREVLNMIQEDCRFIVFELAVLLFTMKW